MAQPISPPRPTRDSRSELQARLEQAPAEHAAALLSCYEIIEGLHQRGALELIRGVLGSAEKVLEIVVDAAREPESIRSLRNLLVLVNLVGSLDPERLKLLTKTGVEVLAAPEPQRVSSWWSIFWTVLWNRDVRRSIGWGLNLFNALGRNLAAASETANSELKKV
jgi:uncharacterized protein YjgD (DUF1641 family)